MKLIKEINKTYNSCLASKCSNAGCKIKLDRICSKHVLISGTKYQRYFHYTDKLCDFILFDCISNVEYRLAVIEMKGGNLSEYSIKDLHKQLQNGADIAHTLSSSHVVQTFIPITVKKKRVSVMASKTLLMNSKYKVKYKHFFEMIKILKHNMSLEFT